MTIDTSPTTHGCAPLPREGLVEQVSKSLIQAIVSGRLAPGARLSESVIAREMGISRAPVREAARLLENSGLVSYLPNRGFFVRQVSAKALDDLYELRLVIETAAVRRLIRDGSAPAEQPLRDHLDELHKVAAPGTDMLTQVAADMAFHRQLCASSGNPRLLSVFEQIATETEFSIMMIGRLYDDPQRMAETHEPILEALVRGHEADAIDAITYHITVAQDLVTRQFRILEEGHSAS